MSKMIIIDVQECGFCSGALQLVDVLRDNYPAKSLQCDDCGAIVDPEKLGKARRKRAEIQK